MLAERGKVHLVNQLRQLAPSYDSLPIARVQKESQVVEDAVHLDAAAIEYTHQMPPVICTSVQEGQVRALLDLSHAGMLVKCPQHQHSMGSVLPRGSRGSVF